VWDKREEEEEEEGDPHTHTHIHLPRCYPEGVEGVMVWVHER
jgi:hypothetical protein